ncbi:MAG: hypothetical protein IJY06_03455 [Oscillospiraceae bacterium]|nr:hypothetical protein [Oscillospiraceae bacterium]
MKKRKPIIMLAAGILFLIAAVIWMIAVKASVNWYMIPASIGGWLIGSSICDL